jgi:hypothetical protein
VNQDTWRETHVSGQSSLSPKPRVVANLFVLGPAPKPALISARLAQTMDARRRLVLQRHAAATSLTAGLRVMSSAMDGWKICAGETGTGLGC